MNGFFKVLLHSQNQYCPEYLNFIAWFISPFVFRFDEKGKNQLYCLWLKMTADFGNFVNKTDEKQKTKDEMNPA